jgi:hypothetical protein
MTYAAVEDEPFPKQNVLDKWNDKMARKRWTRPTTILNPRIDWREVGYEPTQEHFSGCQALIRAVAPHKRDWSYLSLRASLRVRHGLQAPSFSSNLLNVNYTVYSYINNYSPNYPSISYARPLCSAMSSGLFHYYSLASHNYSYFSVLFLIQFNYTKIFYNLKPIIMVK